jgi:hypothetical protein
MSSTHHHNKKHKSSNIQQQTTIIERIVPITTTTSSNNKNSKTTTTTTTARDEALSVVAQAWGLVDTTNDDESDPDNNNNNEFTPIINNPVVTKKNHLVETIIIPSQGNPKDLIQARLEKDQERIKKKRLAMNNTTELRSWDPLLLAGEDEELLDKRKTITKRKKILSIVDQAALQYRPPPPFSVQDKTKSSSGKSEKNKS